MNTARIVVLAIAVAAVGLAVRPLNGPEPEPMAGAAARTAGANAPLATSDIQISQTGSAGDRAVPAAPAPTTVQG